MRIAIENLKSAQQREMAGRPKISAYSDTESEMMLACRPLKIAIFSTLPPNTRQDGHLHHNALQIAF